MQVSCVDSVGFDELSEKKIPHMAEKQGGSAVYSEMVSLVAFLIYFLPEANNISHVRRFTHGPVTWASMKSPITSRCIHNGL